MRLPSGIRAVALALAVGGCIPPAAAADWSSTSAWLLSGSSFELGPPQRTILRLEHASGWAYGDHYFFVDVNEVDSAGTNLYGELVPRLSLGKLSRRDLRAWIVKDVALTGAVNAGDRFRAYLYGLSADLDLPGFAYVQFNAYVRDDKAQTGTTWQLTPIWMAPLPIPGVKAHLQGFVDIAGAEGFSRRNLVAYTRFWLDVGAFWKAPGRIEAGLEYIYWNDKFGVAGVNERVLQPSLRWTF
jgi:nucleoside-specific outer membrane channel protein Tsx